MPAITTRSRGAKRLEAVAFALAVVVIIILGITTWGLSYRFQESAFIEPGGYYVYRLEGYEWSVLEFSIKSDEPVTICITDDVGLRILKSGDGAFCFFKAEDVTSIEKIWRFPKSGNMYFVIIPESNESPISVSLRIRGGLILW